MGGLVVWREAHLGAGRRGSKDTETGKDSVGSGDGERRGGRGGGVGGAVPYT